MEDEKQAFFVESVDGRKFKMVIRGSLSKLSVAKIKRYLKRYGVPENHLLMSHDQLLTDSMVGEDFGLVNNSILHLHDPAEAFHKQDVVGQSKLVNETNLYSDNNVEHADINYEYKSRKRMFGIGLKQEELEENHCNEVEEFASSEHGNQNNKKSNQWNCQTTNITKTSQNKTSTNSKNKHLLESQEEQELESEQLALLDNIKHKPRNSMESVQMSAMSVMGRYMPHGLIHYKNIHSYNSQEMEWDVSAYPHESTTQETLQKGPEEQSYKQQVLDLENENKLLRTQLESILAMRGQTKTYTNTYNSDLKNSSYNECNELSSEIVMQRALANLRVVSDRLGLTLNFDTNLSCVIGTENELFVILTVDSATERLYMYSTVLEHIPTDAEVKMKLYEILLEGSLVGREVCGGGMGISLQKNMVVLASSFSLMHCDDTTLADTLPIFVATLRRWQALLKELVEEEQKQSL